MLTHPPVHMWYVVYTRLCKELMAAGALEERLGLVCYVPEVRQSYRRRMQLRPFFPRYFFVQADLDKVEASAINAIPGVQRLVAFGERPLALTPEVIDGIRHEVDRLNQEGGMLPSTYRQGELIRLREGPLKGLHAVFVRHLRASERAVILLQFLGQENEIEVALADLESEGAPQNAARRRGTRGKGRQIHYPI